MDIDPSTPAAEETKTETTPTPESASEPTPEKLLSEERLLDAQALEEALATVNRPTARAHLENLITKLIKDAAALKRAEQSKAKDDLAKRTTTLSLVAESTLVTQSPHDMEVAPIRDLSKPLPDTVPHAPPSVTVSMVTAPKYNNIDKFSFDAGGYDSQFVTLYIPLPKVGSIPKSQISCNFTPTTFDLIVKDLEGKSYRMFRDDLDKDIDPEHCKFIVKADKIIIKLAKVKGEYGSYDHWSGLAAKRKKTEKSADPSAGIMEMMKEMYEEGDDNMKKMIGETMLKQQRGELGKGGMDDDLGKFNV